MLLYNISTLPACLHTYIHTRIRRASFCKLSIKGGSQNNSQKSWKIMNLWWACPNIGNCFWSVCTGYRYAIDTYGSQQRRVESNMIDENGEEKDPVCLDRTARYKVCTRTAVQLSSARNLKHSHNFPRRNIRPVFSSEIKPSRKIARRFNLHYF